MKNRRNMFVYLLIIAAIVAIIFGVRNNNAASTEWSVSRLVEEINDNNVKSISANDEGKLTIKLREGDTRSTQINPNAENVIELLESHGADPQMLQAIQFEFTKPSNLFNWIGGW